MVCSKCGESGHNKTTCERRQSLRGKTMVKKTLTTGEKKRAKASFEALDVVTIPVAEGKLAKIKRTREEQYEIANKCVESLTTTLDDGTVGKNCSVKAEEKTGKRVIMEAIHLITIVNHGCGVLPSKTPPRSVYVTALNRKDTKDQFREQQEEFGILSIVATCAGELIGEIIKLLRDPSHDGVIYIHLDECDYGTGCDQSLSKLWNAEELNLPKNKNRIKYVTYSATPEELEYSRTGKSLLWDTHTFTPNKDYIGAQWYLDNNLVFKPEVFFDGVSDFSKQGIELINKVNENCSPIKEESQRMRNLIVVRDTGKGHLNLIRQAQDKLEEKYSCEIHIFDQNNGFDWGLKESWAELGRTEKLNEDLMHVGYNFKATVIFISQICTRSTELCPLGHRKIAIWHDARLLDDKKAYNTISQAIGRVKHYTQPGKQPNPIKLYCDIKVLKKTVGLLDNEGIKMSARIQTNTEKQTTVEFTGEYEDGYGNASSVPDTEWQNGDPNSDLLNIQGEWRSWPCGKYGKKNLQPQMWNSSNHGGCGGNAGKQGVIQYENSDSDRWMYRRALYKTSSKKDELVTTFETKKTSMYA